MGKSMKKTMKSMKKKSGMKKSMKKKTAMRVSNIARGKGAYGRVFSGSKEKTSGGLKKTDLHKNADGKIVSKKRSQAAKKNYRKSGLSKWFQAVSKARKQLGIKGFCAVGGKTSKGQALLRKVRSIHRK